ncbi:hypothetical protein ACLEJQ_02255 [Pseudomonas sp. SMV71]|uniref:hypothetical protein n=1 Tax=Pseudomonas sp. SMV71 TaxID=3390195 RepID=UPI003F8773F6
MFEKYPDQARARRHTLWTGIGFTIVGLIFFLAGGRVVSLIFLLPGLTFVLTAIFSNREGFETAKLIGKFFQWFA